MSEQSVNDDNDFRTLSERDLAAKLVVMIADLEDQNSVNTVTVASIMCEVENGRAIIERDQDAIAVVRPEGYRAVDGNAVLWLIAVRRTSRGKGVGNAFVRSLVARHVRSMPMVLICNGTRRELFFSSCGFHLKEHLGDGRVVMFASKMASGGDAASISMG